MDSVRIKIPASPRYLHVVRLVAAGLAARLKFTLDEIEDLKIAVDELAAYLTGAQGREGTLEVTFTISDDSIEITGVGNFPAGVRVRTDLTEFSLRILDTVVDSASLTNDDGVPGFTLTKQKQT